MSLDFVDHDDPAQWRECSHWLGESSETYRIFEVEIERRIGRDDLPGERCLSTLTRTDERHDATARECATDLT